MIHFKLSTSLLKQIFNSNDKEIIKFKTFFFCMSVALISFIHFFFCSIFSVARLQVFIEICREHTHWFLVLTKVSDITIYKIVKTLKIQAQNALLMNHLHLKHLIVNFNNSIYLLATHTNTHMYVEYHLFSFSFVLSMQLNEKENNMKKTLFCFIRSLLQVGIDFNSTFEM